MEVEYTGHSTFIEQNKFFLLACFFLLDIPNSSYLKTSLQWIEALHESRWWSLEAQVFWGRQVAYDVDASEIMNPTTGLDVSKIL